ncbi:serine hydrolase domain-containing protein [Luteimonas sp. TWI1437]|uniref:serine hydrolase domain-containing protein n=1 Tax=unclassified Luteimonas TaxID=2629088 RepID=UPI003208DC3F
MRVCSWLAPLLALALLLPRAASADNADAQALRAQLDTNRQRYGIADQAVLVARNGQVLFRGADGEADITPHAPVTEATEFPVYSLAKLFASTLAMQRIERGALDLDGPIGATLPGLPAHWQRIRLRDLLDHTSGLPEYFEAPQDGTPAALPADARAVFAALAQTPLQFAPGTRTRYTQTNYLVLAALLAADGGKPYPQLVEDRILRPLRLRHTWLGPPGRPRWRPPGPGARAIRGQP